MNALMVHKDDLATLYPNATRPRPRLALASLLGALVVWPLTLGVLGLFLTVAGPDGGSPVLGFTLLGCLCAAEILGLAGGLLARGQIRRSYCLGGYRLATAGVVVACLNVMAPALTALAIYLHQDGFAPVYVVTITSVLAAGLLAGLYSALRR